MKIQRDLHKSLEKNLFGQSAEKSNIPIRMKHTVSVPNFSASPEFIISGDGVRLSCKRYIPPKPRAVVLFY